jgi:4-hydroxybenzoate polyprenyltransferase
LALYLLDREAPLEPEQWVKAGWLVGSALLIMVGGYWLNDFYDVEMDAINRPRRAAKVRLLTRRRLLHAVIIVWLIALLSTIALPWRFRLLHLLVIGALFWYNRYGKRLGLPGNLLIAGLTALLPWELMLWTARTAYAVDWMIPLAAVFNFAREVIKDAEDQPGDLPYGVRSLPTRLHPKKHGKSSSRSAG